MRCSRIGYLIRPSPGNKPDPIALTSSLFAVTQAEDTKYKAIIDGILATADLETISRKKIRQGLELSLGGKDLSEQKVWPAAHVIRVFPSQC